VLLYQIYGHVSFSSWKLEVGMAWEWGCFMSHCTLKALALRHLTEVYCTIERLQCCLHRLPLRIHSLVSCLTCFHFNSSYLLLFIYCHYCYSSTEFFWWYCCLSPVIVIALFIYCFCYCLSLIHKLFDVIILYLLLLILLFLHSYYLFTAIVIHAL